MAGISKAERDARAAAAAAAEQGGQALQDSGESASNDGADEAAEQQAQAEAKATAPAIAAAAAAQAPQLVRMTRDANAYPAPHVAEVHPDEVGNYSVGGWQLASD